jgi:hypothetical protein
MKPTKLNVYDSMMILTQLTVYDLVITLTKEFSLCIQS